MREIEPTAPIVRLREMGDVLHDSIRRPRLLSQTVGIFAGLALLIAVVGTYGLLSYGSPIGGVRSAFAWRSGQAALGS